MHGCYLVFLLLLFTEVATVGIVLDYVLAHVIHSVHQKLQALFQVVAAIISQQTSHSNSELLQTKLHSSLLRTHACYSTIKHILCKKPMFIALRVVQYFFTGIREVASTPTVTLPKHMYLGQI